ncbi:SDR family NAD(P)-dependent oxidoreductase [Arhodomonas sp. SL1]|uniref:SDR family NAD(P)-dependent oxidoreductase n=1 Tax=Arhodomonas sp. SL1 TaxID=3425691 RepID=UPI003F880F99
MRAQRLEDRVVMVIGAGSIGPGWGNGKAAAVQAAREGAKVIAVDINGDAARETVQIIHDEGREASPFEGDATDSDTVQAMMEHAIATYGRLDVVHHNIGIVALGGPVELEEKDWHRVLDINLTSAFLVCKHALPLMEHQGSGVILVTGSIAGIRYTGVPYVSYSTTKAAVAQLCQSVALQYADRGIRANCILPGLMDTPMIYQGLKEGYSATDQREMVEKRNTQCPTGTMGDAWDVANAMVFLASDEARYITGQNLVVDGGITCKMA